MKRSKDCRIETSVLKLSRFEIHIDAELISLQLIGNFKQQGSYVINQDFDYCMTIE